MNGNIMALHMYCFSPGLTDGKCTVKSDKPYFVGLSKALLRQEHKTFLSLEKAFFFLSFRNRMRCCHDLLRDKPCSQFLLRHSRIFVLALRSVSVSFDFLTRILVYLAMIKAPSSWLHFAKANFFIS